MFLIFSILLLFCSGTLANEKTPLKIGFTNHESQFVAAKVLKEVYKRSNLEANINSYPAARLTSLIKSKMLDGEVARINYYYENNKLLKKVETPLYYFDAWVYTHEENKEKFKSLEDFKHKRVGILRGVLYSEILTKNFRNRFYAESSKQLFDLLSSDRLDAVIDTDFMRLVYLKRFKKNKIKPAVFIRRYNYFTSFRQELNSEHQQLSQTLERLDKNLELSKIIQQAEKEVLAMPEDHEFVISNN